MAGRQSSAVERAVADYQKSKRRTGPPSVYRIAAKFGIAASTLYRALKVPTK